MNQMTAKILITMAHEEQKNKLSDCLKRVGHAVTTVESFHNAMEILQGTDFDLIVCDVHLQNGGNVFDFLRWVKGDPHMAITPFVCFSAEPPEIGKYLCDALRTAARGLGAARYISMDHFDGPMFLQEIEWLLPQQKIGSYYNGSQSENNHNGDGHGVHTAVTEVVKLPHGAKP